MRCDTCADTKRIRCADDLGDYWADCPDCPEAESPEEKPMRKAQDALIECEETLAEITDCMQDGQLEEAMDLCTKLRDEAETLRNVLNNSPM